MPRFLAGLRQSTRNRLDPEAPLPPSSFAFLRVVTAAILPTLGVIALIALSAQCVVDTYQIGSIDDDAAQRLAGGDVSIAAALVLERRSAFPERFDLQVRGLTLPPGPLRDAATLCLRDLRLTNGAAPPGGDAALPAAEPAPAGCAPLSGGSAPIALTLPLPTDLADGGDFYKYPFDSFAVEPVLRGRLVGTDAAGFTLFDLPLDNPAWELEIDAAGWIVSNAEAVAASRRPLEFSRALFPQVLTVATLAMIVLFAAAILFVDSFSTAAQVALALVLGIVGVKQVLVPADPPGPLAFDVVIVLMYVLAGLAVALRSLIRKLQALLLHGLPNEPPEDAT